MTASRARASTALLPAPVQGVLEWCLLREAAPRPDSRQRARSADDAERGDAAGSPADRRGERRGETLSDVDLLVHPDHMAHAAALLRDAGFVERPAWGRGSHRFFYRYEEPTGSWLKVDAVTEVAFGAQQELATDVATAVLARAAPDATPAASDEFWILLLHCLLDRHGVCGRHTGRLAALLPSALEPTQGPGLQPLVSGLLGDAATTAILTDVAAGGGDLSAASAALTRAWHRARRVSVASRRLRALAARAWTKPMTARRRRGVAVAVVGPDGAGKSSVVMSLTRTYPFPVLSYYAGQYQGGGGALSRVPGGHTLALLQRQARQSVVALGHALRGRVVVFDRYAYDSLLARPGAPVKTRLRRAVLGRVALRPGSSSSSTHRARSSSRAAASTPPRCWRSSAGATRTSPRHCPGGPSSMRAEAPTRCGAR